MNEIEEMRQAGDAVGDVLFAVALSSIRLYAAFNVLPATGSQFLHGMTRPGLAMMLGAYIAFGLSTGVATDLTAAQWLGLTLKETIIGVMLGFAAATVFWTAECVGALIDTQTGYNNVQLTNPMSGQQSTPVSNLLLQTVIAVFYTLGGLLVFIGAVFESFRVWPLLSPLPSASGLTEVFFLQQIDSMMTAVVKFAAPALLVLVLVDLGFGLVTRSADKLEPHNLSQPVKGAVAMLLLALLVGVFITQVRHYLLPTDLIERLQAMLPR
jgi:type III secretion protein T